MKKVIYVVKTMRQALTAFRRRESGCCPMLQGGDVGSSELGQAVSDGQEVTVSLVAADAGDGNEHDFVVWQQPRLVAPGRPDLLLRDVREVSRELAADRKSTRLNSSHIQKSRMPSSA